MDQMASQFTHFVYFHLLCVSLCVFTMLIQDNLPDVCVERLTSIILSHIKQERPIRDITCIRLCSISY